MKEVNDLLNRLGELEDAPLIWVNKKVYDMAQEIERLNNIINSVIEKLENSDIDLDDKFIWDDRDYSTYELEDLIKILKGDNKE